MSREVEILVPVISDQQTCKEALADLEHVSSAHTVDKYFYDPERTDLQPDESGRIRACMRIRTKEGLPGGWIAYKSDVFDGNEWLYSNEHETKVEDPKVTEEIVRSLGLRVLTIVNCVKHVYMTTDGTKEVVYEQVEGLGDFLEVENKQSVEEDRVAEVKDSLRAFISDELSLEVGPELNSGKPELLLQKQQLKPLE